VDGRSYTIDAQVKIVTGRGHAGHGDKTIFDTRAGDRGLVSITVSNSIRAPFQRCALQFAPEAVTVDGRPWAEAIPPHSLVSVAIHRRSNPTDDASTDLPEPIFLGLVDEISQQSEYGAGPPRRSNQLQCRSLTALLVDQPWWSHSWGSYYDESGQPATKPPAEFAHFFPRINRDRFTAQRAIAFLGLGAFDQAVYLLENRFPPDLMNLVWAFFVGGKLPSQSIEPFIRVAFADDVPLQARLRFDRDRAARNFVDPGARIGPPVVGSQLPGASCWDFFRRFSDPQLQELYSDTHGRTVDDAYVEVISRKRPFAGFVTQPGPSLGFDPQAPATFGESCFDGRFGDWDVQRDTIEVDRSDVIGDRTSRGHGNDTYGMYRVRPALLSNAGPSTSALSIEALIPFIIDEVADSPSRADIYGARPLDYQTPYLSGLSNASGTMPMDVYTNQGVAYEALLWQWHHRNPEMWRGNLTCKGRTSFRVGKRLLRRDMQREYYIEDVRHQITLGQRIGFTTSLGVSRGWDIA